MWEDTTQRIDGTNNIIYGKVQSLSILAINLDIAPPDITVVFPPQGVGLQDGVTFRIKAIDFSGVDWVRLSIRETDGISK